MREASCSCGQLTLTATGAASDVHVAFQSGNGGIVAHDSVTLAAGHDITIDEAIEAPALTLNAPGQITVNVALGDITHPINIDVNAAGTASFNDVIAGSGFTIECVHTPGHTSNHMCYALKEENARGLFLRGCEGVEGRLGVLAQCAADAAHGLVGAAGELAEAAIAQLPEA